MLLDAGIPVMTELETWFERFVDADRVLVLMCCRDYTDVRAFISFWEGMIAIAADREPEPFVTIEELAVKDPGKSKWPEFCGRYEHPKDAGFIVDEVFMKDDELYAHAIDGLYYPEPTELTFRLYPLGKNVFGRKDGLLELTFGGGCLMFGDYTCKKL